MKMDQCDFCGVVGETQMRFTEHYPIWPSDGSPPYLDWEREAVCGCCFSCFLEDLPEEQRQLTLEKNGEGSQ